MSPLRVSLLVALALAVALSTVGAPARAQPGASPDLAAILGDYEHIRAGLARDDGAVVAAPARRIATRARALGAADPALAAPMRRVAAAARSLAAADAGDLTALRRAFGQLSHPLVDLLAARPALARGRHVFECPMAQGYGRWIQPTAELQNPYMGGRMPTCGRPVP